MSELQQGDYSLDIMTNFLLTVFTCSFVSSGQVEIFYPSAFLQQSNYKSQVVIFYVWFPMFIKLYAI